MITKKQAEELIENYYPDVYKFCCAYLHNLDTAKDVTQNVFLSFIENSGELDDDKIRSWLYATALNKIRECRRDEIRQSKICPFDDGFVPLVNLPDSILDLEEPVDDNLVELTKSKLLLKLRPEERDLLISIYDKHMTLSEIGSEIGISPGAVAARHLRLRKKIENMAKSAFIVLIFTLIKLKFLQ